MSTIESWSLTFYKGTGVRIALQSFRGTKEEVTAYIMNTLLAYKHIEDVVMYDGVGVASFRHNFWSVYGRSTDVSSYSNKHRHKMAGCDLLQMETIQ
jgi:hypothetical protein